MSVLLRCLAAVVAFSPAVAFAHVTLENRQAEANSTYKAVLRIPHGCGEQPTLKVRIQIPEGVVAVKPMPKAGWALDLVKGPYSTVYKIPGGTVKEGIKEIVWSGSLPDAYYDELVFQARITDVFQPGSTVYFLTVQECTNGAERWVEIPAPGQEAHALKYPAPSLRIVAAAAAAPASFKAGPLVVEAPWSRATPGGAKVGAGYMRIVNRGSEPDRLIAGTAEVAGKFELHETSTAGGVARMRPVEGGLLIKPGEPVELKPGGLHAMLVDLARPLKEGETIRGTLVFEKAGTVAIEYRVGGIGAQSASGDHHH